MAGQELKSNIEYIICSVCNGSGKNKHGLDCPDCAGMGLGVFWEGAFYYWGPKLGLAVIKLSHLKRKINIIVNICSFLIGLAGLLALGWWFWTNNGLAEYGGDIEKLAFWRVKNWLILFFWISMIFSLFVFYRLSEEEVLKQKIKKLTYESRKRMVALPNNWDELKKYNARIDVSAGYSEEAMAVVEKAYILAQSLKHGQVAIMHLFYSLFTDKTVLAFFSRLNVNKKDLFNIIKNRITGIQDKGKTELSLSVKKVLIASYILALNLKQNKVKVLNLILPCNYQDKVLAEILYDLAIDNDKIINCLKWFIIDDEMMARYRIYRKMARFKPGSNMDRAYTAVATPVLNHFAYDLTLAAKWGRLEFCVARENEIKKIFQQLESGHTGVILYGEDGIGKNSIVEGIAQMMVEEDVPKILKDKRLIKLDVSRLISGAIAAKAQERLLVIIDEIIKSGNIILYINNIENLVGITAGDEESMDLSEVLVEAIERKNIFCLATATNQNYVNYIEDTSLGAIMANIKIKEPDINEAIQIVESKIGPLEFKYKVYFSYNAVEDVIKLTAKYIHDEFLPAKAIKILELVAVKVAQTKGEAVMVDRNDIAAVISEVTGIPLLKITEEESDILLNLEAKIHERMINQEEAVNMVAASLRRARAEMSENKRPIASFLFLGPTGVGKTELAKTVADIYFGSEKNMIRLDMSEYQHQDSIGKMIGETGSRGYLTEAVRKAPFSLILLDEIEKAHKDILNLFLQVMDDGRLTDAGGRTIDFTNAIIIATSNAGAVFIQEQLRAGINIEMIKEDLINEYLNKVMRPELLNRFDGIIVFKPLSMANVEAIAGLMLKGIGKMLEAKGIRMKVAREAVKKLARAGFDPKFGARPLRRLLQDKIENVIANKILSGELVRRDTLVIDSSAEIKIEKRQKL
ncbi:hypothetical protein CO115_03255 [Candidatus Falkowbacteria bacterium CG_4_9_14_3_um_filter_36_9]|uniref:Clp R domain-containing protein n=1 Tax=Candidatus Falkowbacteria bacterium CG02_land_8_20_14_3_00_36_14 TaxID=1974560 RepID=A0A2M7DN09_9BACT|nr:MAG: hypothetical protein COS18_03215 [Candidatus Falkowbacteria bacterium CG02_land_8_20_14_3_00_36_14]PJA11136.1 MAG: hypothetical protein COX67_01365 [Candidatus Falkowbacteria bacterium CG_4_10_14_0_2_um_filter_36_22]PJB19072.1 MAG: hypothetical protein CO115_03255 [Candidatus Falkowbacteria bacterium CG_4_9_14_3_um_filter_36_9]